MRSLEEWDRGQIKNTALVQGYGYGYGYVYGYGYFFWLAQLKSSNFSIVFPYYSNIVFLLSFLVIRKEKIKKMTKNQMVEKLSQGKGLKSCKKRYIWTLKKKEITRSRD